VNRTRLAGAVVLMVAALGCSSSSPRATPPTSAPSTPSTAVQPAASTTAPPASNCARPHASGQSAETFTFEGQSRTYQLFVPRSYDGRTRVPLVFDFHGFGSGAVQQMIYGDFKPLAERDGFLVVAPDGQGTTGRHFNLGLEPALQNDVQMVGALLDRLEATLCVDPKRVFSTGMSNGGAMTAGLACQMPDRFGAFAAVAVIFYREGCAGARPVAITAFSGTADPIVPFNGGKVNCCGGAVLGSAPAAMAGWAAHDHCRATYTDTRIGTDVRRRMWSGCDPESEVVFYIVDGGGHTWPGAIPIARLGKTTNDINASAIAWDFFKKHPLR
jgi:polyhydroxybutyrate depolymerase